MAATEISTWTELLATVANTDYIWTGGNLNFDEIQPEGFSSTINIKGNIDFNGAIFFNLRSTAANVISQSGDGNSYLKNLTFQNIEHIPTTTSGAIFLSGLFGRTDNLVVTGTITGECSSYILFQHGYSPYSYGSNNRVDRIGCDVSAQISGAFFVSSDSSSPNSNPARMPIYDSRIKLNLVHSGSNPFPYNLYNCRVSGTIDTSSSSNLVINSYYSAISLDTDSTIDCANLNLVRSDLATYSSNPLLVRCDSPFWEHKSDISASGFPYGE